MKADATITDMTGLSCKTMAIPGGQLADQVLRASGINKRFGSCPVLTDVSFTLRPGEILGLIGPNGAGKTTLLECVIGLLAMDRGELTWQDKPLAAAARKNILWYQPDNCTPFAWQRVAATLSFFGQVHQQPEARLWELIERLELTPVLNKPFSALSKGYGRRVLLALALLSAQPFLLLDEPFDGFDPRQVLMAVDLLRREKKRRGMLLSIHQLGEAEKICDRFLLLAEGKNLACGSMAELRKQAGSEANATLEEVFLALT